MKTLYNKVYLKFAFKAGNSVLRPDVQEKSIPKLWHDICEGEITKSYLR